MNKFKRKQPQVECRGCGRVATRYRKCTHANCQGCSLTGRCWLCQHPFGK